MDCEALPDLDEAQFDKECVEFFPDTTEGYEDKRKEVLSRLKVVAKKAQHLTVRTIGKTSAVKRRS